MLSDEISLVFLQSFFAHETLLDVGNGDMTKTNSGNRVHAVTDMDVTTVNHTACIPLNQLPDHTIQHVFREYRKIRKVEVHLLGAGEEHFG